MFVDPGIGFGKTREDNYRLLAGLHRFGDLGYPVLVGPSRKSFLAAAAGASVRDRLEASLAAATSAVLSGAHVIRVHDVRETRRALVVADAVLRASR
jgi:dihydropteroate synthase